MSKRSVESMFVKKYKSMYEEMNNQDLADELDAISDQLVALMLVSDSTSIEVMYDRASTLKISYTDHVDEKGKKLRETLN